MSQITLTDINNLAELAKIQISENESEKLLSDVSNILGFVSMISDADTSGIQPVYNFHSVSRDDEPRAEGEYSEDFDLNIIMGNVRDLSKDNFVKVAKVIDK
jgi:aspartyl-tRNA(Asn)/glutamyl-tRNA(Gln) amidotransferase subunit C